MTAPDARRRLPYLAQVYSTLFPSRVRRMVPDSNVDPRKVWYQANLGKPVKVDGRRVAPIVLIGETLDAATPFSAASRCASAIPGPG